MRGYTLGMRHENSQPGAVTTLLCFVFLALLLRTAWLSDDGLITLRTVLNLTHGYGLTFNIAERVQTYTHPLWMLMLTGAYLVVGNVYYAAIGLSVSVSLFVFWLTLRQTATSAQVWIVAAVLLSSRAFVDFSTSGLENPLSNLLLVAFVGLVIRSVEAPPARLTGLWIVASLLYLTRPDAVLLVAPALIWLTARTGNGKGAARQMLTGLLPAAAWTAFALIYYGVPFPNTVYAKLGTGIDRSELAQQGWLYLVDSVDRDPVTLVAILFAVTIGLACRGPARWIAAGVLIDLAFVVSIGGDFMSGRFLALPLVAAVLILSRAVPFEPAQALTAAGLLAVVGLTSAQVPLLSDSRVDRTNSEAPRGIVDERAFRFRTNSLVLANRQSFPRHEWPASARLPVPMSVMDTCGGMGHQGLWGPMTHLLDKCALADPLLARLPAIFDHEWRIGHFQRMIPEGYRESLEQGANRLADTGLWPLYDDLRLITRAPRLLSRARLAAIWRVNTGGNQRSIDRLFYRHALIYTGGWYPEETSPESTWRWTHQTATLAFQNPKADATFYLEYAARPDIFADAPQTVTVSVGDQVLQSFVADAAGRRRRRIPLPGTALGHEDIAEIRITVNRTFVPANRVVGSHDTRELGIQVYHAGPFPPAPPGNTVVP